MNQMASQDPMKLVICQTCRKQMPLRARFCSRCGSILVKAQRPSPVGRVPLPHVETQPVLPISAARPRLQPVNPLDYAQPRRRERKPLFTNFTLGKKVSGQTMGALLVLLAIGLALMASSSSHRSSPYVPPRFAPPPYVPPPAPVRPELKMPPLPSPPRPVTRTDLVKPNPPDHRANATAAAAAASAAAEAQKKQTWPSNDEFRLDPTPKSSTPASRPATTTGTQRR